MLQDLKQTDWRPGDLPFIRHKKEKRQGSKACSEMQVDVSELLFTEFVWEEILWFVCVFNQRSQGVCSNFIMSHCALSAGRCWSRILWFIDEVRKKNKLKTRHLWPAVFFIFYFFIIFSQHPPLSSCPRVFYCLFLFQAGCNHTVRRSLKQVHNLRDP